MQVTTARQMHTEPQPLVAGSQDTRALMESLAATEQELARLRIDFGRHAILKVQLPPDCSPCLVAHLKHSFGQVLQSYPQAGHCDPSTRLCCAGCQLSVGCMRERLCSTCKLCVRGQPSRPRLHQPWLSAARMPDQDSCCTARAQQMLLT